jgi:hypothetical protein
MTRAPQRREWEMNERLLTKQLFRNGNRVPDDDETKDRYSETTNRALERR